MSLRPFFRNLWDDPWFGMTGPSRLFDQNFGMVIPDTFLAPAMMGWPRQLQMQRADAGAETGGLSEVVNNEHEFRVSMDVQHFKPEEINIKVKDNRLIIEAKHEDRPDEHGFIMRQFIRQFVLPRDVDPNTVTSSLSRECVLTMRALKKPLEAPTERRIPITNEASK